MRPYGLPLVSGSKESVSRESWIIVVVCVQF
jgi:hypothetical protein